MTSELLVSGKYVNPLTQREHPRVTSILNAKNKPALVPWATKLTSEVAGDLRVELATLTSAAAVKRVKDESNVRQKHKANVGSEVHAAVQARVEGTEYVPNVKFPVAKHVAHFERWVNDFDPRFLFTETHVFSDRYNYAGTFDAIVELPGMGRYMLDYKTGGLYPETALQVCAYTRADYMMIGPPWEMVDLPPLDGGLVLRITEDDYELRVLSTDDDVFDTFLFLAGVVDFDVRLGGRVIGPCIVKDAGGVEPPGPEQIGAPLPVPPSAPEVDPPSLDTARATLRGRVTTLPVEMRNMARKAWKQANLPPLSRDDLWTPELVEQADRFIDAWEVKANDEASKTRQVIARQLLSLGVEGDDARHAWVREFNGKAGLTECSVEELRKIRNDLEGRGIT